jgi:hypothetical protein
MDRSEAAIPAFLTLVGIPLTFSIANGLAFGIAAHALIKLVRGKIHQDWLLLVLAGLFIVASSGCRERHDADHPRHAGHRHRALSGIARGPVGPSGWRQRGRRHVSPWPPRWPSSIRI